jgi:hypothetical protein
VNRDPAELQVSDDHGVTVVVWHEVDPWPVCRTCGRRVYRQADHGWAHL